MEKMSFLFLIIIISYLTIIFLRRNKTTVEKKTGLSSNKTPLEKKEEYEKKILPVIVTAIACVMGKTPYVLKRVYLSGDVDEKKSAWRIASRSESATKRNFFK